jgi:hypothetical protein
MRVALSHGRRHFAIVAWLVFLVSLLKGLRMPSSWSATHMTFNYSHGFIRRGLVGEVIRLVSGARPYSYNRLALLAILFFVAVAVVMVLLVKRVLDTDPEDVGLKAVVLAFAASPGVVMLANAIGYLDYVGLLLVVSVILISARSERRYLIFFLGIPVGVMLAFIHEAQTLMFAPTILFAMICHIVIQFRRGDISHRAKFLLVANAALGFIAAFGTSAAVGIVGTKSPDAISTLQASVGQVANFRLRSDAFATLSRPVSEAVFKLMPSFWRDPGNRAYLVLSMISAFPAIAFVIFYGMRLIGRLDLSKLTRVIVAACFIAATLAPVGLNLIGWDSARWNAISLVACFCCVAILRLYFSSNVCAEPSLRVESPLTLTLAAVAIVLGLCSSNYTNFLFDGHRVQGYPFEEPVKSFIDLVKGHFTFMPRD